MRFNELNEKDIELIKETYLNKNGLSWEKKAIELSKLFEVSERTIRKWVAEKFFLKEKEQPISEQYELAKKRQFDKDKQRFIITWAQSNTNVHKKFLENIEAYAKEINADIHVILGRYKNPTSLSASDKIKQEETWSPEIIKYSDANRHDIHKYVSIMSDVKIQPTAVNPMSGLNSLSGVNTCIFGAPKIQMEMIPVLDNNHPKMMLSTGALTIKNYTDSKAGKKGDFHHTFGFCIIEIKDDEVFYVRQVTADDKTGSFNDLCYNVQDGVVNKIKSIEAIVFGDMHFGHHDQNVIAKTLDLLKIIKPKHVVLHDVFDGYSISHHELKDPFIQYGKEINGTNDLNKEIDILMNCLKPFEQFDNVVIVRSNHDDFLDRWLKNEDWKKQPTFKNSRLYMQLSDILLEQYSNGGSAIKGVIPHLINKVYPKYITLDRKSSYKVKGGWELGVHGDLASNGSRGSLENFRRLNTKIILGHYHTPGRKDGALAVGTSTKLRLSYNLGPSSWLQSHVIIHNDGKAQHICFMSDKDGDVNFTTFFN